MPTNHALTIVSAVPASVVIPNPGAPVTAESVEIFTQSLADWCQALLDGKIVIKGGVTFLGDSGGAIVNNGTTTLVGDSVFQSLSLLTVKAGGAITLPSTGTLTSAGKTIVSGRRIRGARVALAATTQTVDVSQGNRFTLTTSAGGAKVITLKSTAPNAPDANETFEFLCNIPGSGYIFKREDATTIATFAASGIVTPVFCNAEFEFSGGTWRLGANNGQGYDGSVAYGVIPDASA